MSDSEIIEIIENGFSMNDVCLKTYGYTNVGSIKKIKKFIEKNKIDITHFGKINKNTKYEKIENICPICNSKFIEKENYKKTTCSFSCANKFFKSNKSKEEKEKISNSLKDYYKNIKKNKTKVCVICKIQFEPEITNSGKKSASKTCGNECRIKLKSEISKNAANNRIKNGQHKGWQSRKIESYPEKFFKIVLENNKIKYEFNKPIKKSDLGIDCSSNYFLDFYLPEKNIDLEIDGKQHEYEDRKEMDMRRDEYVSKFFYVYRIKWKNINNVKGKKYISEEIEKFLIFYNSLKVQI